MYFYIHKINKNEQNKLLEMCTNACLSFRNDTGFYFINHLPDFLYDVC